VTPAERQELVDSGAQAWKPHSLEAIGPVDAAGVAIVADSAGAANIDCAWVANHKSWGPEVLLHLQLRRLPVVCTHMHPRALEHRAVEAKPPPLHVG